MPELVLELVKPQSGVERNQHRAEAGARQECYHPFRAVRQVYCHSVARLDAQVGERRRQRAGLGIHLRVREPPGLVHQAFAAPVLRHLLGELLRQVQTRQSARLENL